MAPQALKMDHQEALPPHVLIFPLPLQGHVNSMLKMAELLCLAGFHVTFLCSEYNYGRLILHSNVESHFTRYSGFRFATMTDGLPDDHPRTGERAMEIVFSLKVIGKEKLNELMVSTNRLSYDGSRRPITCLIMDGVLRFAALIAEDMGIPCIYFRTVGACSFWANFCIPDVIEAREVPLKGIDEDKETYWKRQDLNLPVTSVPGMEDYLRRRDLPSFFRVDSVENSAIQIIGSETRRSAKARALILNSFEELEGPILDQIRKHCPTLFSVGPLHAHLKSRLAVKNPEAATGSGSFWEEDRSCVAWLDSQPPKSVLYVSFGSITILTKDELMEFWYGLVNSKQKFLWVMRPDSIVGEREIPVEIEQGTKARGYMVGWAPQEEVLVHQAVGGFLTHCGWNSTLESIYAGVPMLCWPYFADQQINSRFVSHVWKIGLDMKDTCNRLIIEKMIRDLMNTRKDEFQQRAKHMAELAKKALSEGGTSYTNLDSLFDFIRSMVL